MASKHGLRGTYYGLTEIAYQKMLAEQDNRCAICQVEFTANNVPHIDHDHTCCPRMPSGRKGKYRSDLIGRTNKEPCGRCVRGLLCRSCNAGLGMFQDNPQRMLSAIRYLAEFKPKEYAEYNLSLEAVPILELIIE